MKLKYVKLEEPKVFGKNLLLSNISCSRTVEKYFGRKSLWVKYDVDIESVDASILNIPVLSNVITVAWASGADVYVKELDKSYFEALEEIRLIFKNWYPKLSFSTNIHVEKLVSNKFSGEKHGLLFSGGVDSLASYIRHRSKKPNLIMIWGADIPLDKRRFWIKVKEKYEDFARQEGVQIDFIKTNLHEFLNEGPLNIDFGRYLTGSWWGSLHHGVAQLGICAPLTVVKGIGKLLIASSNSPKWYPWGSHWLVDNKLMWADIKIHHDEYLSRQDKIRKLLKEYLRNNRQILLRVCYSQFCNFNCNKCEKCRRTIVGLVLENIDPAQCGFSIDQGFFDILKMDIIKGRVIKDLGDFVEWHDIQRHIPKKMSHNLYNCKEFFDWFREFNILENIPTTKNMPRTRFDVAWCLFYIYYKFPRNVRRVMAKLLKPVAIFVLPSKI